MRLACDKCRGLGAWAFAFGRWVDACCPTCGSDGKPTQSAPRVSEADGDEVSRLQAANAELLTMMGEVMKCPRDEVTREALSAIGNALSSVRQRRVIVDPSIDNEETTK